MCVCVCVCVCVRARARTCMCERERTNWYMQRENRLMQGGKERERGQTHAQKGAGGRGGDLTHVPIV